MDDIIVLILTLIIILAGIIGQTKKKPVEKVQAPSPHPDDDLWTLPGEKRSAKISGLPEEGKVKTSSRRLFPGETEGTVNNDSNNYNTKSELKTINELKKTDQKSRFPLKKAIIYSEILKRKYI